MATGEIRTRRAYGVSPLPLADLQRQIKPGLTPLSHAPRRSRPIGRAETQRQQPSRRGPRRPLGLAPILDGDDGEASRGLEPEFVDQSLHPLVAGVLAGITEATRKAPATIENTFETLDVALRADDTLHSHIVALRNQVRELKGELIEERVTAKFAN